jgi:hypothetical protein
MTRRMDDANLSFNAAVSVSGTIEDHGADPMTLFCMPTSPSTSSTAWCGGGIPAQGIRLPRSAWVTMRRCRGVLVSRSDRGEPRRVRTECRVVVPCCMDATAGAQLARHHPALAAEVPALSDFGEAAYPGARLVELVLAVPGGSDLVRVGGSRACWRSRH